MYEMMLSEMGESLHKSMFLKGTASAVPQQSAKVMGL
jgi:hypothetical protein